MIWGRSLPPVHDFLQVSFQETGGLEWEPLSVPPALNVRKRLKGANERLAVLSSMCCPFNAVDAVCTAWHALAPFRESSYTSHFCICFVYLHLLVYLYMCLCVWIPILRGSWELDSVLRFGIRHLYPLTVCPVLVLLETRAIWFSWSYTRGQGGFCFTRPLLHVCHCSTVSCFLLIQGTVLSPSGPCSSSAMNAWRC